MVLLSNDEFISQLTVLTMETRHKSAFTVTLKRYNGHDRPKPRDGKPALPEPDEFYCLMRATSRSKKLSTVVKKHDVPRVMESYARIMKISMDGLKKVKKLKSKSKSAQG